MIAKKVERLFHRACADYQLLADGDRVIVALSGGKDSMSLVQLMGQQQRLHKPRIEVRAVHVVMDNIAYESDTTYLERYCQDCGMELTVLHTEFDPTTDTRRTPCYLCAHYRRKALFEYAVREGYNKVALGHHQDDILTTLLMSLTFEGAFSAMPASLVMEHYPITLIRPLCLIPEALIREQAELSGYQPQRHTCPYERTTHRNSMEKVFHHLETLNPEARYSLWNAMNNIKPAYLVRQLLVALVALFCTALPAHSEIIINEIMAANVGDCLDPSDNFSGWIELYNSGTTSYNLNGVQLTDHKGQQTILSSDHGKVPAHGFLCLWFGHYKGEKYPYLDLKLDCEGGSLKLTRQGQTVAEATYPAAIAHSSWARTTDGGNEWSHTLSPTPQGTNNSGPFGSIRTEAPIPSHQGGWVEGPVDFYVTVPQDATLYYTTDGRLPTRSSLQATPDEQGRVHFSADSNSCYRFRCIASGEIPSAVVTRSFISRHARHYVEGGWDLDEWGDWIWADGHYEDVELDSISLLSVVTDPDFLFDNEIGIYVEGTNGGWSYWTYANYYRDWDRPVSVEIYDAEDIPLVNQEADMCISGGYSRTGLPKSFKLKSDRKFEGVSYYHALNILPEKPYNRYKDLLVRAGGAFLFDRYQDNALQWLVRSSGFYIDSQAYRPVHVFFNGQYQDRLFIRDCSNHQFGYSNYGMDTDEMDTLEESDITALSFTHGTSEAFERLYKAASRSAYDSSAWEEVQNLLDVEEWAHYFAIETYTANQDWPQNNIKMFRDRNDGRFHVVLQDLDACFHEQGNTFDRLDEQINYMFAVAGYQENRPLAIFLNLMNCEEFRRLFVNAFCIVAGSVLQPDRVDRELNVHFASLQNASETLTVSETLKRYLNASWQRQRLNYLQYWRRAGLSGCRSINAQLSASKTEACLLLNGQPVPKAWFNGTLFLPATVEALVPQHLEFEGWYQNGQLITTTTSLNLTEDGHYEAVYRSKESATPIVINEVSAANAIYQSELMSRSDWLELYNTTDHPIDLGGCYISNNVNQPLRYRIPSDAERATLIPAHGYKVLWADNKVEATPESSTQLHLPFKLANADYQVLVLTAADGSWADTLYYHAHTGQQTVGRIPDGGASIYRLDRPSIEAPNLLDYWSEPLTFDPLILGQEQMQQELSSESKHPIFDLQGRPVSPHKTSHTFRLQKGHKLLDTK